MSKDFMPIRTALPIHPILFFVVLFCGSVSHAEFQSGFFAAGNDQIYYEVEGRGFPLVMVSGGSGMDLRQWDRVVPNLAKSYKIVRYDPRGIGKSDNPTERYSDTRDLHDLLAALEIGDTVLIGLSSSGGLVLEYALQHRAHVLGVIAAAPFVPGFQFSKDMLTRLQIFSEAAETGRKPFLDSMFADPHFIPAPLDRSIRASARENMGMNYDKGAGFDASLVMTLDPPLIEQLTNISPPVLLLAGALDHSEVHRRNDFLAKQIRSTRQSVVADAGHNAPLENPDAFLNAIRPFLEELSRR
jgi:pimeloyl-ACP methyl ester carboxylesterase